MNYLSVREESLDEFLDALCCMTPVCITLSYVGKYHSMQMSLVTQK